MITKLAGAAALGLLLVAPTAPAEAVQSRIVTYPKAYDVSTTGAAAWGYITFLAPKSVKYDGTLQDNRSDGFGVKVRLNIGFTDGTTGQSQWIKNQWGAGSEVAFIDPNITRDTRIAWVRVRVCTDYDGVEQNCALGVRRENDQL